MITNYLDKLVQAPTNHHFDEVAWHLLNSAVLLVGEERFRLREIEFYLHSPLHQDVDSHCNSRQGKYGQWYFHRFKNPEKYPNQIRKGIDLTFGHAAQSIYGGILIRAISTLETKEIIDGPTRTVNRIIDTIGMKAVHTLATSELSALENDYLCLEAAADLDRLPVSKAIRKGLGKKENAYKKAFYRYFTYPQVLAVEAP